MKVTLIPRSSTVEISNQTLYVERLDKDFFDNLNREVVANPKQAKRLLKMLTATHAMLLSSLVTSKTVLAAPLKNPVPQDITDSLLTIIGVMAAMSVGVAIITLMIAGMWKMLFGKNRADAWTTDIIRGLLQAILAPVLVALIVGIATLLFSNIGAFQPIISPITVFFHH